LFRGLLTLQAACPICGLDFGGADTGDAGAVIVLMLLGTFVIGMAFWVEFRFNPPLWVHAILWPVITCPLAVLITRPMKAALLALQFRTRPNEMGL
jgi:uncharacterized protein (DUF983 family)